MVESGNRSMVGWPRINDIGTQFSNPVGCVGSWTDIWNRDKFTGP
jgi:hypothetical protein